jgi:DNA-binding CsgD family transcriptional regulator
MRKPKKKHGLTQREYQVFKLRAEGLPYKAIGAQMGISQKTVYYYVKRIFTIMNCHCYADLIKRAIALGVICICLTGMVAGQTTTVLFSWDKAASQYSNSLINLYYTTNITLPTNQWPFFVTVYSPTNISSTRAGFYTNLTPNAYFFSGKWTNTFWHDESPFFSAAAFAPPDNPTNPVANLLLSAP